MEDAAIKSAQSFKDLRVWQAAYKLAILVYRQCEKQPKFEQYGLSSQMSRAAVSVCSNIAEGFGRKSAKEKDQFYAIANGSLTELENQLVIANGIGYLTAKDFDEVEEHCTMTHKMLNRLQTVNKQKGVRS
jgi:four helix bundle protein